MNDFKELCSDDKWVKDFNRLNSELLKAASYFSGNIDPDSVKELDDESIRQCNEAYKALAVAVKSMHGLFESIAQEANPPAHAIDWRAEQEKTRNAMLEWAKVEAEKEKAEALERKAQKEKQEEMFRRSFGSRG